MQGGGVQQRRHFGGSRQGGWWNGCADKVERWRAGWALLANRRSLSLLTPPCSTLPQVSGERLGCGLQLRKGTTTTAPNPPHNTCPNPWCRGRGASESSRRPLNASDTQPRPACLGAGGGGVCQRIAQAGHGGNTPRTPQEGTFLEAEDRIIRRVGTPDRPREVSDRSGRLRAHIHAMVDGGGWERGKFLYRCGVNRVGVLYPSPMGTARA